MLELHTVPFALGSVHGKILEMFWAQWDSKGLYRITICTKKERSPYFLLTQPLARLKQQQHQPEPARHYELKLKKVYLEVCVQGVHDYPQRLKSRFFIKKIFLTMDFLREPSIQKTFTITLIFTCRQILHCPIKLVHKNFSYILAHSTTRS